jgi:hypothetical protein
MNYMWGRAVHDAMQEASDDLAKEMGMTDARRRAQQTVRTRIPNPFDTIRALQKATQAHPELRDACDDAITVILILRDKNKAALACLQDMEWPE